MEKEKLKTLRDIEIEAQEEQGLMFLKDAELEAKKIRDEAVKWVNGMFEDDVDEHAITSFMNFFNLTEEDLE